MHNKARALLLLAVLAALCVCAGTASAATTLTSSYTDFGNGWNTVVNLTTEGSLDWMQFSTNANATAVAVKGVRPSTPMTATFTPAAANTSSGYTTFWTDGALPFGSGWGETRRFQTLSNVVFTAPVDPAGGVRVLKLWLHSNGANSTFNAHVGSDADTTLWTTYPTGATNTTSFYGLVRLYYSSTVSTDLLTVTWTAASTTLQASSVALGTVTAPIVPASLTMPSGTVGVAYNYTMAGQVTPSIGGALTFTSSNAPAWMTLAANGTMTGTPTAAGPVAFTVSVAEAGNATPATVAVSFTVNASGSPVTKIAFVRDRKSGGYDLTAYKAFLENTVYPGRTMVYYDTPGRYMYNNFDANKAELLDSDLIVWTNDYTTANYDFVQWQTLNVPIMFHSANIATAGSNPFNLGMQAAANTYTLRYGPNSYKNEPGNQGWMIMYHLAGAGAGTRTPAYYTPNTVDPFYAGLPTTPYAAGDNVHGGPQLGCGGIIASSGTVNGDLLTADQYWMTSVWFQVFNGARAIGASSNYDVGQGRALGLPTDSADPLSNNWYNKGMGYNPSIVRWNQGDQMYRWNQPAPSRRFMFPSGSVQTADELTTLFNDPNGAALSSVGQLLLKNALTMLYNPANGRRPVVSAGAAAATVYFSGAETQHDFAITDATYTDPDTPGATGTYAWSVLAVNPANNGNVTIASGGSTLTPTIRFLKPGTYTATLKAVKSANLDAIYATRTFTVVAAAPTVTTWPTSGLAIETLTGMPVVVTFNQPVAPGASMTLTVNGSAPLALTNSGDNMKFTCDAIGLGAVLPTTDNTAVPFVLNTSTVTSLANGTAFGAASYTWNAMYNSAAHSAFRIRVCNGYGNNTSAYAGYAPLNSLLQSVFGPYAQINWIDTAAFASPNSPATVWADFSTADLIIIGGNCSQSAWNAAAGWIGATGVQLLKTPILVQKCWTLQNNNWASNTGSVWANEERYNPVWATDPTAPLFKNISSIPTFAATIPMMASSGYLCFWQYPTNPNVVFGGFDSGVSGTGWEMAQSSYSGKTATYWPGNTQLRAASTITHVGRRAFWGVCPYFQNIPTLNADGMTAYRNMLSMVAPLPGAPLVVSTNPGATASGNLTAVSVTFDHSINVSTPPGNLTITGVGTYGSPVASNENRTWTYTVPAADMIGKPTQTLHFSVVMTGVTESESGLNMPYAGPAPYTWDSLYDVAQLGIKIVLIRENSNNAGVNEPAFLNLAKSVYGSGTTVQFLHRGTTAETGDSMNQTTGYSTVLTSKLYAADFIITDGMLWEGAIASPRWNDVSTYTKPILECRGYLYNLNATAATNCSNWWSVSGPGLGAGRFETITAIDSTSPLFNGVSNTAPVTVFSQALTTGNRETPNMSGQTNPIAYPMSATTEMAAWFTQPNSSLRTGSTVIHAGRRGMFLPLRIEDFHLLTSDGLTLTANMLKMMRPVTGQPTVYSTDPGAQNGSLLTKVTVTFDRMVTAPGALTVRDAANNLIGTYTSPTSADSGVSWVYTIPIADTYGKLAQTFHFSMATTGVYETESGLQLPFATSTYTWDTAYDPARSGISIFGVTQSGVGLYHKKFESLAKTIWGSGTTVYWQNGNWANMGQTVMTAMLNQMNASDLVYIDGQCDAYNFDSGHGWWANTGTGGGGPYTGTFEYLTRPLLVAQGGALQRAQGCDNYGQRTNTQLLVQAATSPVFSGVTIPGDKLVTIYTAAPANRSNSDNAAYYNATNASYILASTTDTDQKYAAVSYMPAGTRISTLAHPGDIGFFELGPAANIDLLTNDGRTILSNLMRMLRPLNAQPTIVSVSPAASSLFTQSVPATISVTFDRSVSVGAGSLTVNGADAGTPTGSSSDTIWTWNVPVSVLPNIACSVNVVLTQTGIYETLSGVRLPMNPGTYSWSFSYDPTQFRPTIALVSNSDTSDSHSAYVSFLTNDCYSTTLYTRSIVVEDVPGKYYSMSAATAATMGKVINLAIVLPYQVRSSLSAKANWNGLAIPIMVHKVDTAVDWGFNGSTSNYTTNDNWDAWFYGYWGLTAGYSDWTMVLHTVAGDELLAGTNANVNAFGGDDGGILFSHTVTGLRGLSSDSMSYTLGGVGGYGQSYRAWGWFNPWCRWQAGNVFWGGGSALAKRVQMSLGPQASTDNYGRDEAANFFGPTGAHDLGGKQVLRNALRWMMNPDSFPFPVKVKSTSPALVGGTAGVLGPITVVFSKPVSGVLNTDLTWNASTSGVFYTATAATPSGTPPTDTWTFTGAWQTNAALIGQYQTIYMDLNPLDSATHSHIISVDGDGCPRTQWAWSYQWTPAPASVPAKQWSLYQ